MGSMRECISSSKASAAAMRWAGVTTGEVSAEAMREASGEDFMIYDVRCTM